MKLGTQVQDKCETAKRCEKPGGSEGLNQIFACLHNSELEHQENQPSPRKPHLLLTCCLRLKTLYEVPHSFAWHLVNYFAMSGFSYSARMSIYTKPTKPKTQQGEVRGLPAVRPGFARSPVCRSPVRARVVVADPCREAVWQIQVRPLAQSSGSFNHTSSWLAMWGDKM